MKTSVHKQERSVGRKEAIYISSLTSLTPFCGRRQNRSSVGYDQVMNLRRFTFPGTLVDHYKSSYPFPKASINKLREEAYREVTTHPFEAFPPGVYSVILLTGMARHWRYSLFACKLRNALFEKKQLSYRIIYTLPFLSIIDQTRKSLKKSLKQTVFL